MNKHGKDGEDAAAKLAEVRRVLSAFDWERDDRQYALEQIGRIVATEEREEHDPQCPGFFFQDSRTGLITCTCGYAIDD